MSPRGRRAFALAALMMGAGGAIPACACTSPVVQVIRLSDAAVLAEVGANSFVLHWRHSVTKGMVSATYSVAPDGTLRQTEERFADHGPGLAFEGAGWRQEADAMVLPLDREIPRLILRTAPEHRNRVEAGGQTIDLTRWPGQPLELLARPCKDTP